MGLKVTIESAKSIGKGIWKARLKPQETSAFGDCSSKSGPYSVLLLTAQADFNEHSQSITFNPNQTRLLNVGTTNQIIIISATPSQKEVSQVFEQPSDTKPAKPIVPPEPSAQEQKPEYELSQALSTGDKLFLSELPPDLRRLGETLLSEVRRHFKGELSYEPRFAKFDETPEIFLTVKIQPEDSSLRITVRGTPDNFPDLEYINLKADKFGYSAFVITDKNQIPGAVTAIRQAAKNIK
jgi:hypothetical protein